MKSSSSVSPKTLLEAIQFYENPENCEATMINLRFPHGMQFPRCVDPDVVRANQEGVWQCNGCGRPFTLKMGTVLAGTKLSLSKWLPAMWLLAGSKKEITSIELARALGVTENTSWFMLHRIRYAGNIAAANDLPSERKTT